MEPSMSPFEYHSLPEGVRAWLTLTVGTDGGRPLIERVSLTEAKIIEVNNKVEDLKEQLEAIELKQSSYGKSTIFLLLGILGSIIAAFFQMHK